MTTNKSPLVVSRGEIWEVRFDPSEGDEIRKTRPAVVMNVPSAGRMALQIVVPVTGWQTQFAGFFWMVHLSSTNNSGLSKESAADAFQIKSVSINRFRRKIGSLNPIEINQIAAAIVICIGYKPQ